MSAIYSCGGLRYLFGSCRPADPHAHTAASIRDIFEEASTAHLGVGVFSQKYSNFS